jgi:hypothetical protein
MSSPFAQASPISFQADSFLGPPGTWMGEVAPLPDLSVGGSVPLGVDPLIRPDPSSVTYPPQSQPINEPFSFAIRELNVPGQTDALSGYTLLTVYGQVTGSILGASGVPPRNGGSFSGVATRIDVTSLPGVTVPQQLLDLASHPERIHITGVDTWLFSTDQAAIDVSLTIDPPPLPAAIPEPTTAVTIIVGFILAACRWHVVRSQWRADESCREIAAKLCA